MQRSAVPAMSRGTRAPAIAIFCAYIAFVLAGLALFTLGDDLPFIWRWSSTSASRWRG